MSNEFVHLHYPRKYAIIIMVRKIRFHWKNKYGFMARNTTILFCCRTDHLIFPVIKKRIFLMKYFVAYKKVSSSVRSPPYWIYTISDIWKATDHLQKTDGGKIKMKIDVNKLTIRNHVIFGLVMRRKNLAKKCIERILGKKIRDIIGSETPSGVSRTVRALLRRSSPSEARVCERFP